MCIERLLQRVSCECLSCECAALPDAAQPQSEATVAPRLGRPEGDPRVCTHPSLLHHTAPLDAVSIGDQQWIHAEVCVTRALKCRSIAASSYQLIGSLS